MKRLLLLLGLLPLFAIGQEKGKNFKLSGALDKLAYQPEWVYLQYKSGGEWKTDSVKPLNGVYSFSGSIAEPSISQLRIKYAETSPGVRVPLNRKRDIASLYLEPGKIKVNSVDSFSNIKVKGSSAHTEYAKIAARRKPFEEKMEPLYLLYSHFNKN
ncbi:MAG TPA: DUF4369 domain-containing protein, partial [Chitinophagaceae bacterium]|nr:DUF4369 domain-containing protein [Chitinophagaceae bacterium]